jgi:hypothetical protein
MVLTPQELEARTNLFILQSKYFQDRNFTDVHLFIICQQSCGQTSISASGIYLGDGLVATVGTLIYPFLNQQVVLSVSNKK